MYEASGRNAVSPESETLSSVSPRPGNVYLRSLLVEYANHVLGRHGKDSTLRQWGLSWHHDSGV
jgi:hypothetical protein